jgi:hypothetical protein
MVIAMNEIVIHPDNTQVEVVSETPASVRERYGFYVSKPPLCPICNKRNHMEINLLRARDHLSLDQIVQTVQNPGVTRGALVKHFDNHFILLPAQKKILDLKEDCAPESLEIVSKVFDGEVDIFSASQSILKSQATRLHVVVKRLEFLNHHLENDSADDIDKQEFIQLHKVASDIENSMQKTYSIMDKKLFPTSKEELSSAILQYKLTVLSKLIDSIQLVLLELERNPKYTSAISAVREELAKRIGNIEDEVLKSGGIIHN